MQTTAHSNKGSFVTSLNKALNGLSNRIEPPFDRGHINRQELPAGPPPPIAPKPTKHYSLDPSPPAFSHDTHNQPSTCVPQYPSHYVHNEPDGDGASLAPSQSLSQIAIKRAKESRKKLVRRASTGTHQPAPGNRTNTQIKRMSSFVGSDWQRSNAGGGRGGGGGGGGGSRRAHSRRTGGTNVDSPPSPLSSRGTSFEDELAQKLRPAGAGGGGWESNAGMPDPNYMFPRGQTIDPEQQTIKTGTGWSQVYPPSVHQAAQQPFRGQSRNSRRSRAPTLPFGPNTGGTASEYETGMPMNPPSFQPGYRHASTGAPPPSGGLELLPPGEPINAFNHNQSESGWRSPLISQHSPGSDEVSMLDRMTVGARSGMTGVTGVTGLPL